MSLDYSLKVKQVVPVFKEYRNTIDIYTEDGEKDKEFYKKIFSRLLSGTDVVISDVTPLGCRCEVIKSCHENTDLQRNKLYIVDGDIFLQFREKETHPNLYVLDAYCIENFTISKESLIQATYCFSGALYDVEKISSLLDYENAVLSIVEPFLNLFFVYSIQAEFYNKFELRNVDSFLEKGGVCSSEKIDNRILEIKKELIQSGLSVEKLNEMLEDRKRKFPYSEESLLKVVSGKDYLIPYFRRYAAKQLSCQDIGKLSNHPWKFQLGQNCDLKRLYPLRERILELTCMRRYDRNGIFPRQATA